MMRNSKKRIIALFLLLFLLRIPSLFEPYWYGDEGLTLTMGEALRRGAVLYKDVVDNKPPFLYFLAAAAGNLTNLKALTLFWSLISLFIFLKIAQKLFPKREHSLGGFLFLLLIGTPLLEANIANGEIYMLLPTLISIYFFLGRRYFLCGFFASLAFLFKAPAFLDFLAVLTFLFLKKEGAYLRIFFGFLLPLVFVSLYFFLHGAFFYFLKEAFLNNFFYTTSWQILSLEPHFWLLAKIALLALFILYLKKREGKLAPGNFFLYLWFAFSLFGATLSNRPYLHYLLQLAAPSSLLFLNFLQKRGGGEIFILLATLSFFLIFQFKAVFTAPFYLFSYYRHFLNPLFFDPQVRTTYELTAFLRAHTQEKERIFVWSDNTLIYALSKRRPATRFLAAYHILGKKEREREVGESLLRQPPKIIIVTKPIVHYFTKLEKILKNHYYLKFDRESYLIYEVKK